MFAPLFILSVDASGNPQNNISQFERGGENENDLSEEQLKSRDKEIRGHNMKWFDRALAAFFAGMLALFAFQILYIRFVGLFKGLTISAVGIIILIIAAFLFFIGYKGHSPF